MFALPLSLTSVSKGLHCPVSKNLRLGQALLGELTVLEKFLLQRREAAHLIFRTPCIIDASNACL